MDLPDGLYADDKGLLYFYCRSCDRKAEWPAEPEEFDFDADTNVCGGSPRCLP